MRMAEGAEALEIAMDLLGGQSLIYPAALWDARDGATLFDSGLPDQMPDIERALAAVGIPLQDVRRILLTHQDVDHIGSAAAIAAATGAEVYAHAADVPSIQGEQPLLKLDASRYEARMKGLPEKEQARVRKLLASPPRVHVDHVLGGGEELPFHGGITVIPSPGHTPGHVCYYLRAHSLLIAGDALRVEEGSLIGPSPLATPDMRKAVGSLANLLPYRIKGRCATTAGSCAGTWARASACSRASGPEAILLQDGPGGGQELRHDDRRGIQHLAHLRLDELRPSLAFVYLLIEPDALRLVLEAAQPDEEVGLLHRGEAAGNHHALLELEGDDLLIEELQPSLHHALPDVILPKLVQHRLPPGCL
jgi:glyoxylase-like metal-dependent hydrolase (beta-lactamase superfamily II)